MADIPSIVDDNIVVDTWWIPQVDVVHLCYVFAPLRWVGMNAMLVYVMAAAGIFEGFLNGWYYDGPNNTLVTEKNLAT